MSRTGGAWANLGSQPWWIQALVWSFALPVAAVVWASSRRSLRRTSLVGAGVLTLCCLMVPLGLSGAAPPDEVDLRSASPSSTSVSSTSQATTSTSTSTAPTTLAPTTGAPTTTTTTIAAPTAAPSAPPATAPAPESARSVAERLLSQVSVAEEVDQGGYDRDLFEHWIDADGDGCNTRCEVLLRQQLPEGGWFSTYDRVHVASSSDLDVDHVVALAEAWRSGAWSWDQGRRRAFANDLDEPRALIAVTGSSNRSKSDRDPASWRPAAEDDWCQYAISWLTVKTKWSLSVDPEEFTALRFLTDRC